MQLPLGAEAVLHYPNRSSGLSRRVASRNFVMSGSVHSELAAVLSVQPFSCYFRDAYLSAFVILSVSLIRLLDAPVVRKGLLHSAIW